MAVFDGARYDARRMIFPQEISPNLGRFFPSCLRIRAFTSRAATFADDEITAMVFSK